MSFSHQWRHAGLLRCARNDVGGLDFFNVIKTLRTRRHRRRAARSARIAGARGWRWRIRGSRGIPALALHREECDRAARVGEGAGAAGWRASRSSNSWAIANYLEDTYPDRPSLFGGEGGRAMARMSTVRRHRVVGGIFPLIVADIPATCGRPTGLFPRDAARRASAARRWNRSRPTATAAWSRSASRSMRCGRPSKSSPSSAARRRTMPTTSCSAAFQWARATSPFKLLKADDPVYAWREKLLDAFDGMARKSPGHAV